MTCLILVAKIPINYTFRRKSAQRYCFRLFSRSSNDLLRRGELGKSFWCFLSKSTLLHPHLDEKNTSTDERMADCQIAWSITMQSIEGGNYDSATTFDDVTDW